MKQIDRRKFLKTAALTAATTAAAPLLADRKSTAAEDYKALICIALEGGADTLNMVLPKHDPTEYRNYVRTRPGTAYAHHRIRTLRGNAYGLHPQMARMQRLFNYGNMAIVANVGTLKRSYTQKEIIRAKTVQDLQDSPEQLFEHISQRDLWMMSGDTQKGWAARLADQLGYDLVNISVGGENSLQYGSNTEKRIAHDDIFGTDPMMQQVRRAPVDTWFETDDETQTALGTQLQMVLDLIEHRHKAPFPRRQIYFVSDGGWDIHDATPQEVAKHFDRKVARLDHAIGHFFSALEHLGLEKKVTTFTLSEFGRTVTDSGSRHGWGGHAFVTGGAVKSGIYGKMPKLSPDTPDALADGTIIPTMPVEHYFAPLVTWLTDGKVKANNIFPNLSQFDKHKQPGFIV